MSELMNTSHQGNFRLHLLASVSAAVLMACSLDAARADDNIDRPTIWIELGGQLEQTGRSEDLFAPPFAVAPAPNYRTYSPLNVERPSRYSNGGEGKVLFQPQGTDWVFSASIRYGRSNSSKHVHQSAPGSIPIPGTVFRGTGRSVYDERFSDTKSTHSENHTIADFQAGRDIGLGMFGKGSTSTVSLGVRFAQFASTSQTSISTNPDYHFIQITPHKYFPIPAYHSFAGSAGSKRSFQGVGPSLSWDASAAIAGNPGNSEFTFDWGVNAAILFGRQKARTHHSTLEQYNNVLHGGLVTLYHYSPHSTRARSVTVPNVGGFAGLSLKFPNAKISLGYRADFFFNAMDGGVDVAHKENRSFYGPFATISFGIGG